MKLESRFNAVVLLEAVERLVAGINAGGSHAEAVAGINHGVRTARFFLAEAVGKFAIRPTIEVYDGRELPESVTVETAHEWAVDGIASFAKNASALYSETDSGRTEDPREMELFDQLGGALAVFTRGLCVLVLGHRKAAATERGEAEFDRSDPFGRFPATPRPEPEEVATEEESQ